VPFSSPFFFGIIANKGVSRKTPKIFSQANQTFCFWFGSAPFHCNSVKFWTALSDLYVGDKDSQPVKIIASIWTEIPINTVTNLRFKSATGGAVYIISAN